MARRSEPRLRIVAGALGGRRLRAPRGAEVRPSAERTREAIFSMLGPLDGGHVLDLFCGSGALGIEALSRGAEGLTLVDSSIAAAKANVELLAIADRCELVEADAVDFLRSSRAEFDLILCDPPYRLAARLGPHLDKLLPARLATGGRVITESSPDEPLELALPLWRERRYGAALVRCHREGS